MEFINIKWVEPNRVQLGATKDKSCEIQPVFLQKKGFIIHDDKTRICLWLSTEIKKSQKDKDFTNCMYIPKNSIVEIFTIEKGDSTDKRH